MPHERDRQDDEDRQQHPLDGTEPRRKLVPRTSGEFAQHIRATAVLRSPLPGRPNPRVARSSLISRHPRAAQPGTGVSKGVVRSWACARSRRSRPGRRDTTKASTAAIALPIVHPQAAPRAPWLAVRSTVGTSTADREAHGNRDRGVGVLADPRRGEQRHRHRERDRAGDEEREKRRDAARRRARTGSRAAVRAPARRTRGRRGHGQPRSEGHGGLATVIGTAASPLHQERLADHLDADVDDRHHPPREVEVRVLDRAHLHQHDEGHGEERRLHRELAEVVHTRELGGAPRPVRVADAAGANPGAQAARGKRPR